jgi:tRNA(Ile)-lysidine synthase
MLDQFIRHIRKKNLLDTSSTYLVALSGGLDSVVLTYLMQMAQIKFILAHCNFGLRGEESDGDESFVRNFAQKIGKEILVRPFETKAYAAEKGMSTQMAARELRYGWFNMVKEEMGLKGIVVAHHLDDQVETVLLNLMRGTGIEGIFGMADHREDIIRPLLPFTKAELEEYAKAEGLEWREDSSNTLSDYKRNFLRNEVLPLLKEDDPSSIGVMKRSFDRIKETGKAYLYFQQQWLDSHLEKEGSFEKLPLKELMEVPGWKSVLYYWLRGFGFNYFQTEDVEQAVRAGSTGSTFESGEGRLNLDRDYLIFGKKGDEDTTETIHGDEGIVLVNGEEFEISIVPFRELDRRPSSGMFDADKLEFPLKVRNWREGDRFRPLGMKNHKKISDFLIDLKVPMIYKNNIKLLCSGHEVVWVIGHRVDDRFKVGRDTKTVLYIKKKH